VRARWVVDRSCGRRSGPSGGRHVCTETSVAIDPARIGTLAPLASAVLPSLDIPPLHNIATRMCDRPRDFGRWALLSWGHY